MTDAIEKRLTIEEFAGRLKTAFGPAPQTITIGAEELIEALSVAFFHLQEETTARVRKETVIPSLN